MASVVGLAILAMVAGGCTSTDHIVANRPDLLSMPSQTETIGEAIEDSRRQACHRSGATARSRCARELREWDELLGPPALPEPPEHRDPD